MQYYTQIPQVDPVEFKKKEYKKNLRKDSNKIGALLIISEAIALTFSLFIIVFSLFSKKSLINFGNDAFSTLESGLMSFFCFFLPGLLFCIINKRNFNEIFPFRKNKASDTTLFVFLGLAISLASNYASDLLTKIFSIFSIDNSLDMGTSNADDAITIIVNFFVIAILPAFIEEFLFRGVIFGVLEKYSGGLAVLISSILFGLMHANFVQIPFAFCVGLALGFVRLKSGSMVPSIIIHCLNNATATFLDIFAKNDFIGLSLQNIISYGLLLLIAILGIISAIILLKKRKEFFTLSDSNNIIPYREKVKTVYTSPTIIIFTVFVLVEAIAIILETTLLKYI